MQGLERAIYYSKLFLIKYKNKLGIGSLDGSSGKLGKCIKNHHTSLLMNIST